MTSRLWALVLVGAFAGPQRTPIGEFSAGSLQGWEAKRFHGTTSYELVELDGVRTLRADSRAAASGLYKKIRIDLMQTPFLHWSWRVDRTLGALDETTRSGDDYAARLYVVVSGGVFFWNTRALNYVWANTKPEGAEWPNAFTDHARMVALRSGDRLRGRWTEERRDVRADWRRAFGDDIRAIDAVALMTDTDNSESTARAYYGDIYFAAE